MDERAREQIKLARQQAGLSLRELGRRIGVSASLLSQIEQGKSEPSVSTLYALVNELGVSLDRLLGRAAAIESATDAAVDGSTPSTRSAIRYGPVVRPAGRARLEMDSGVLWEQLTRGADPNVDNLLVTYGPGGKSSSSGKLMTHSGVEYAYLIEGELTLRLGFESYVVKAGDSLCFDAAMPHMYINETRHPAKGVWFVLGRNNGSHAPPPELPEPNSAVDVLEIFGAS